MNTREVYHRLGLLCGVGYDNIEALRQREGDEALLGLIHGRKHLADNRFIEPGPWIGVHSLLDDETQVGWTARGRPPIR